MVKTVMVGYQYKLQAPPSLSPESLIEAHDLII